MHPSLDSHHDNSFCFFDPHFLITEKQLFSSFLFWAHFWRRTHHYSSSIPIHAFLQESVPLTHVKCDNLDSFGWVAFFCRSLERRWGKWRLWQICIKEKQRWLGILMPLLPYLVGTTCSTNCLSKMHHYLSIQKLCFQKKNQIWDYTQTNTISRVS